MSLPLAAWYQRNLADPESDIAPHFATFARLVEAHDVRWIIELGVREGASTSCWLYHVAQRSGHLWSVDVDPCALVGRRGWTFVRGDDLDPVTTVQLPDVVDLVFIDTDHDYEHTLAELDCYGARVRAGGVIVLHDTANEHPECHGEAIAAQEPFPVRRAMTEWADAHGYRWSDDPASWGLGVIYV